MADQPSFQWQNPVLLKTIYPLRETKLRDFLIFYKEIDLWAQYKNAPLAPLQNEYIAARKKAVRESWQTYAARKAYFLKPDVRLDYAASNPLNEAELARIHQLHEVFGSSFKYRDIRKEKYFVADRLYEWERHRDEDQRLVTGKQRRIAIIRENNPSHPNLPGEEQELTALQAALNMAQAELDRLRLFLASFEKIEKRKLELFNSQEAAARSKAQLSPRLTDLNDQLAAARRKSGDPARTAPIQAEAERLASQIRTLDTTLNTPEEAFVTDFKLEAPLTPQQVTNWKLEEYSASLASKDHRQLLEEIVQRFVSQPARYPLWLQYMVIHFSGMRYASAHGSWANPKDLLVNLRSTDIAADLKKLDDSSIAALAGKTRAVYTSPVHAPGDPMLASATDPDWKQKVAWHLKGLASASPASQRSALLNLRVDEENYEVNSLTPEAALENLKAYKTLLPDWMWKEIVGLTQLRVTEAKDPNWDKLTDEEQQERWDREYDKYRQVLDKWKAADVTGWREQHDATSQLIVTRAVCNEVAEHIQHLRGWSPPGGLTPKFGWYRKHEQEKKVPGNPPPYVRKPAAANDYTPGASILWLRFVEKAPNAWQAAHPVTTATGEGLLNPAFLTKKAGPASASAWNYFMTDPITRSRTFINEKKVQQKSPLQYLRWIHEATVVDVAETAEGTVVLTFEPGVPYEDRRVSSIGIVKHYLTEILSEGSEDGYNRSFVGYLPEGQVPAVDLEGMLDWNKILERQFMPPGQLEEYRKKYIRKM